MTVWETPRVEGKQPQPLLPVPPALGPARKEGLAAPTPVEPGETRGGWEGRTVVKVPQISSSASVSRLSPLPLEPSPALQLALTSHTAAPARLP